MKIVALIAVAFALLLVQGCVSQPQGGFDEGAPVEEKPSTGGTILNQEEPEQETPSNEGGAGQETGKITLEQLAAHSTSEDCWMAVDGKVYDVTPIMNTHPSIASCIVPFCGKDGTNSFYAKEHPASSIEALGLLYKGDLE